MGRGKIHAISHKTQCRFFAVLLDACFFMLFLWFLPDTVFFVVFYGFCLTLVFMLFFLLFLPDTCFLPYFSLLQSLNLLSVPNSRILNLLSLTQVNSRYFILSYFTSADFTYLTYFTSAYFTSAYLSSPYFTLACLTSVYFTSAYFTSASFTLAYSGHNGGN